MVYLTPEKKINICVHSLYYAENKGDSAPRYIRQVDAAYDAAAPLRPTVAGHLP
ncbi:hypothetical protein TUM12370_02850 [Salmonella enterica subsp. enterica serovar Choleraesuis]|nr:hypothetical protein TUM12370_02850 [Salmonella enterica subsp. enterica serovar Choleraesuis]